MIERSRFITTVAHTPATEDARAFIDEIRREFPDANHNCWAYVAGPPGSTAAVGLSDAGEPHGTAGRPMLDILLHSGIGQVAAVVTRFFGGTKLGKGGLVRAYGGCVQHALRELPTLVLVERRAVRISVGYSDVELLRRLLHEHGAEITGETYAEAVTYHANVPAASLDDLGRTLQDGTAGRARLSE